MTILLVDDHPIVRDACRRLLVDQGPMHEAADAASARRMCAENAPDLIILDINLPDGAGLDLLRWLRAEQPAARVVVFSMYEDPALVRAAFAAGAAAFVSKNDAPDALLDALRSVGAGDVFVSPVVARRLALSDVRAADPARDVLTPRERRVMELLGEGMRLIEIAEAVGVSYRTAASIVAELRRKLGLRSTSALIRRAVEARGALQLAGGDGL